MRNVSTPEEHAAMMSEFQKRQPGLIEEFKRETLEIEQILANYDARDVLGALVLKEQVGDPEQYVE